ncbi:MAG TPA: hypothetical protein VL326_32425 [Kofleriaceae bacterium]|nr:hypothetical protein [Kofleriaceae bacterium]
MRIVATLVAVLALASLPLPAHAEDRAALQAKGEQLAKDGKYSDAIEAFKAADRIEPRAIHACLISLAYTRRELWAQAELYLSFCHQRAKSGDPLPDWVALADQQIRDRLIAAGMVEVTIEAKPATAQVTVSSFAPDEVFEPRTIHLPAGTHVVFAKAPGYIDGQLTVQITDKTPKHVVIELAPTAGTATPGEPLVSKGQVFVPDKPVGEKPETPASGSKAGMTLFIAGGAAIALGVGAHAWMGFEHGKLAEANEPPITTASEDLYAAHSGRYDAARILTVALYATGVACIGMGFYQRSQSEKSAKVAAAPLPGGGAIVSVGWQR